MFFFFSQHRVDALSTGWSEFSCSPLDGLRSSLTTTHTHTNECSKFMYGRGNRFLRSVQERSFTAALQQQQRRQQTTTTSSLAVVEELVVVVVVVKESTKEGSAQCVRREQLQCIR